LRVVYSFMQETTRFTVCLHAPHGSGLSMNCDDSMTESATPRALILAVESGPCQGASTTLRGFQAVFGRDAECTLCLEHDSTVSRRHASLSWEGGRWLLRDLGSKNGTFLNVVGSSEPIADARAVTVGDSFILGSARIAVRAVPAVATATHLLRIILSGNELRYEVEMGTAIAASASGPYRAAEVAALQRTQLALIARGQGSGASIEAEFLQIGHQLAELLLPPAILESLQQRAGLPLSLVLDPALIGIAWESLVVGEAPLGLEGPVARRILLDRPARAPRVPGQRVLIIANPGGDLPVTQAQGEALLELLTHEFAVQNVRFLAGNRATMSAVSAALAASDVAIYLGHAAHDPASPRQSGWRLADGILDAARLATLPSVPTLVVAAACESARETPSADGLSLLPDGTGVAASFMLAGVEQYVGTLWRVPVVSGTTFGTVLLRGLLAGNPMGEALTQARAHLRGVLHAPVYVLAGQVHYGAHDWYWHR